ncbi:unnamed protein product, partial [Mesorhabditis belari]|uniref:NADP-dependent oxidoreductase domain-containing protein n=1 Tax=Mesorhabditis belari TaxID=2138241 RepID=A0AAF3EI01_9BILA
MLPVFVILVLISGTRADYDFRGRDYVRQKAERLVFGVAMVRDFSTMPRVLDDALSAGYRTFDTAQLYGNEAATGNALNQLLHKHGLTRSLNKLNLGYIDLMLIHWPKASPDVPSNPHHHQIERKKTWQVMEKYYRLGKIKAIGVSNYLINHLEDLLSYATIFPAVNQAEYSLSYQMNDLVDYCARKAIVFQAYSCQLVATRNKVLNVDRRLTTIARKYSITPKMLEYAFSLNRDISVVMGSKTASHMRENRALLKIKLSQEDLSALQLPNGVTGQKSTACRMDPRLIRF